MSMIRMEAMCRGAAGLCVVLFLATPSLAAERDDVRGFDFTNPASYYGSVDGGYGGSSSCDLGVGCGSDVGCGSGVYKSKLFGLIAPTASGFERFVSPMTNPFFFEDPRTLTEVKVVFVNHDVPSNVLGGGDVQLLAVQARAALTERLSLIATKDGFLFAQPDVHPDGWVDIAAGLKYNLYRNVCKQRLLSAGFTYEMPVGSPRALQGSDYGDGDFHLFASGGAQIGSRMHWISGAGVRLAVDTQRGSDLIYASNHLDYELTDRVLPFLEFNWFRWTRSGGVATFSGLEGGDLYNLGSTNVDGNEILTMGTGVKLKPFDNVEVGGVFEFPLTTRKDLLESRLTFDCIIRY